MSVISKKEFMELAGFQGVSCISVFLPTHKSGQEVINKEDLLLFKNQLKEVGEQLENQGFREAEIRDFLEPARALMADASFWRFQKGGLAVYLAKDFLRTFFLPFAPDPRVYVSNEFYLTPLIPALAGDGSFYLLGLNLHQITFYEGNREGLRPVYVKDISPQRLEEVVGYDYKERSLQFHTQPMGQGHGAAFHGRGEWKGEFKKEEILHFFREVDKGLSSKLSGQTKPLMVAGLDYLFSIYQEANTYPHLFNQHVSGNPEHLNEEELHNRAWKRIFRYFDTDRREKIAIFEQLQNTERTSFDLQEILPAAIEGRIDTLFLQKDGEVWGKFEIASGKTILDKEQTMGNTSLLNLLVKEVIAHNGQVFLQSREAMPQPFSEVNALYRY